MASNTRILADEDGDYEDWIEIYNSGSQAIHLQDWCLTDSPDALGKWSFPATNLSPGHHLVVFASEKDRRTPGAPLHTNFKLSSGGEYLALVRPDGIVADEFSPAYPQQFPDVSFGRAVRSDEFSLITASSPVRILVPPNDSLDSIWVLPEFDDSAWREGINGVGYDTGSANPGEDLASTVILAAEPLAYWRLNETSGTTAGNQAPGSFPARFSDAVLGVAGLRPPAYGGFELDNRAVELDGWEGYVGVDRPMLNHRDAFTLMAWIRPSGPQAERTGIIGQNDAVEFGFINASTLQLWTPGGGSLDVPWSFPENQWHQVVGVGDGSSLRIYIDGTLAGVGEAETSDYGSSDFALNIGGGGIFDEAGNGFRGQIDEAAVWTRALSPESIRQIHQAALAPAAGPGFAGHIQTDLQSLLMGRNSAVCLRYRFSLDDPASMERLLLRVKYDDGFAAFLNGVPVAAQNAPDPVAWNSTATASHANSAAVVFEEFDLGAQAGVLRAGTNVLAIQGLNLSSTNADFLVAAELVGISRVGDSTEAGYLQPATPGQPNSGSTARLGPLLSQVASLPALPDQPLDQEDITITARVNSALSPVTVVRLHWRVQFGVTNQIPMLDDGLHGDNASGDGIYGATIPASGSTAGQLVRWYVTATDADGRTSRWPFFPDPLDSEAFLGTVVADARIQSRLPVVQVFWPSQAQAETRSGVRGCVFYQGELYDNVLFSLRGQSTSGFQKKGFNLDFTRDHRFRFGKGADRAKDVKLMTNYGDKSKTHNPLFCDMAAVVGCDAHWSFQVRVQANAAFHGIFDLMEDSDDLMLERLGRDPAGALYKMYNDLSGASGNEKKTRRQENLNDLQTLVSSLNPGLPLASRVLYAYDNLDLPQAVSYFVASALASHQDHGHKNYYLYCDNDGTGEWAIFPWDVDLSWGRNWTDQQGYFSDTLYQDNVLNFYNQAQQAKGALNRFYAVIFNHPDFRAMYLRRLRTVVDALLPPPGTPADQRVIENRIRHMLDQMDPPDITPSDADLDEAKWGTWGAHRSVREEAARIIDLHLPGRRDFLINNPAATLNGERLPGAQPSEARIQVAAVEFSPASGNQAEEFLCLTNSEPHAVDISGWKLGGAVDYEFRPGTVIPAGRTLYVAQDVKVFRSRSIGPRRGQGLFVQGNYRGQLSARGETIQLWDSTGRRVASHAYAGNPSPAQQFLRVTEMMYHPASSSEGGSDDEALEYIELKNIGEVTLDLSGVRFVKGVEFSFDGSAVTRLAPGARVLVVGNLEAFRARYGDGAPVAGEYIGNLDNAGERLCLVDAVHEEILDFRYDDQWFPITDGYDFSLVVTDETAEPDAWGKPHPWRPGSVLGGSPGLPDAPASIPPVQITEVLTRTDAPQLDAIELGNPTDQDADIGGWWLTDDRNQPAKFRIPAGTILSAHGYRVFDETHFNATPGQGASFSLDGQGEEVWLFSADGSGALTGHLDGFEFGAAAKGVSFGRYLNSAGEVQYPAQRLVTLGGGNAGPLVGPVVINEIRYAPRPGDAEFIELKNIGTEPVPLYPQSDPARTWRLNGVGYVFPTNQVIPPGGIVLLTDLEPATFRSRHDVPANVPVYGPYSGSLQDDGERLELQRPDEPTGSGDGSVAISFITVDAVAYRDHAPWPTNVAGQGTSVERIQSDAYGDESANWRAGFERGSPGMNNDGNRLPRVNAGSDQILESALFPYAVTLQGQASDDGLPRPPGALGVQWSQVDGPGPVLFEDPNQLSATVQVPGVGVYVLRLSADDGEWIVQDDMSLTVSRPPDSPHIVVPPGSVWRYLDDGSNPGTAWRGIHFDDSSWKSGKAQLGYGDGDETTIVGYGPNSQAKFITTYFRTTFSVTNVQSLAAAVLVLLRDDGPVVYLNGVEVFRDNLPEGEINYRTTALNSVGGTSESEYLTVVPDPRLFREGLNVMAVEMHQNSASSSDLSFDLGLAIQDAATNRPPAVDAGPDQEFDELTDRVVLSGSFLDDGLPAPPGYVTVSWSKVEGPGQVMFGETNLWRTEATFSQAGSYILRLTADDGSLTTSDDVRIAMGQSQPTSPRIASIDAWVDQNLNVRIRFLVVEGRTYVVQACDSLGTGVWQDLPGPITLAGNLLAELIDPLPASHSGRFYRIVMK